VYCYFGFKPSTQELSFDDPSMIILPGYVALSGIMILLV
jgi:hypothetical protein